MSCAVQKREGEQYVPDHLYELSISYDDKERAFRLKFTSHADDEICIPKMSWTDENGGHYFFEDRRIYFVDHGIRYDIKDLASGYCTSLKINGCINILKKNDQIFGKLPIEDFVVPSEVYLTEDFNPQLHYPYAPRFCTVKRAETVETPTAE
jgi:hypothetical protein